MALLETEHKPSNQKLVFELLQKLTGQSNVLTIPRLFVEFLNNDHGQALFLSQLIYWSDKGKQPDEWFYKTYAEWYEETLLTEYKIRKATKFLETEGILQTKIKKANGNPTVHYKINPNALSSWLLKKLKERNLNYLSIEPLKTSGSITKTTPKNTTETTKKVYITLPRDGNDFLSLYLDLHQQHLHKEHVRVTEEQLEQIESDISKIKSYDIKIEEWKDKVIEHFENLPASNNGNILAFLAASMRHFEVNPYF